MTGIVQFYNTDKGYGFIEDTTTNKTYFFHISSTTLDRSQKYELNGRAVTFDLVDNDKKPGEKMAVNVDFM